MGGNLNFSVSKWKLSAGVREAVAAQRWSTSPVSLPSAPRPGWSTVEQEWTADIPEWVWSLSLDSLAFVGGPRNQITELISCNSPGLTSYDKGIDN